MKRSLILLFLILGSVTFSRGQLYTGGKGNGATMSCVPPKVTTLGEDLEIQCVTSDEIVLAIYASGSDLQYIWQKFKNNFFEDLEDAPHLVGLGTDTLRILHPQKDRDDGKYRCLVRNSCDEAVSEVFVIDLNTPPVLIQKMSAAAYAGGVCADDQHTVSVDLMPTIESPEKDHTYSWVKIDTLTKEVTSLPDVTGYLKVNLKGAVLEAEGLYVVTASNVCGEVKDSVFLPVYRVPIVQWQNVEDGVLRVCMGEAIKLQAIMEGGGTISECELEKVRFNETLQQWERQTGTPCDGIPEKNILSVNTGQEGYWRWKVTNNCGTAYSEVIQIIVEKRPAYVGNGTYLFPPDTTVCEGSDLKLMCKAAGENIKYYWQKNGVPIEGCDSNVLELKNLAEADAAQYTCMAYNACQSPVRGQPINVKLALKPRFLRDPYMPVRACMGDTLIQFKVQLADEPAVDSIRWMFERKLVYDGEHYENTDKDNLFVKRVNEQDGFGEYQVKAYNKCGASVSVEANLFDLGLPPVFDSHLADYDALLCPGEEQKLVVSASGSAPIHYRWLINEHTYETDTNIVYVQGQNVSDKNKYMVFAYNSCGSAIDSGWLKAERFDYFDFIGKGEVCEGAEPTGYLELGGSDPALTYTLYRDYGIPVQTFQGTGDTVRFQNMLAGIYYVTVKSATTQCTVEMNGRAEIVALPSPLKGNLFLSAYHCNSSVEGSSGAELVLSEWEKDVKYTLQTLQGKTWTNVPRKEFTGGKYGYPLDELNSPAPGEPKIFHDIPDGRYRIVAKNPASINECESFIYLEDSVYTVGFIDKPKLTAARNDTVNCIRMADGQEFIETATLQVDSYIEGAVYTLYKNGVPDPDHEPDVTAPISWSGIDEGVYKVLVTTKEGCTNMSDEITIRNVKAPQQMTLSGGDPCVVESMKNTPQSLYLDNTEVGITYTIYQENPYREVKTFVGDGNKWKITVPGTKITYYVAAVDPTGQCKTVTEEGYTMLASDFHVAANPADIFVDGKGKTTWLHVDITGSYVMPLQVEWEDENQLQQTGMTNLPNQQIFYKKHWPFCDCSGQHYYDGSLPQGHVHNSNCTRANCALLYHKYDPTADGCVYMGTEYGQIDLYGSVYKGPKWDIYYCKGGVPGDMGNEMYINDTLNPFRNRLTTPVTEDRIYKVKVTDGAGCVHEDQIQVRVMGGKLRTDIKTAYSDQQKYYPFCPCGILGEHQYHRCSASCTENNCPYLYHSRSFDGCTKIGETVQTFYKGKWVNFYDQYFCCSEISAADTIVDRNEWVFLCSDSRGGDYNYKTTWSYEVPGNTGSSWSNTGDSVYFQAKESGWLRLRVTSMDQEARDSIWVEVVRKPFEVEIQDVNEFRIDTLYLCRGDEATLYGYYTTGDSDQVTMQWWGPGGLDGPNERWWIFTPEESGDYYFSAVNDGVVKEDMIYIKLQDRPQKPIVANAGKRCVVSGTYEDIRVEGPTEVGANYVLEYSKDGGKNYAEYARRDNSPGGALLFRITTPVRDTGVYRVRVEGEARSSNCDAFSDMIELILKPAHDEILSKDACPGEQLYIHLHIDTTLNMKMSYTILQGKKEMETIQSPLDYFETPFWPDDYLMVYTNEGHYFSCSDTIPFTVRELPKPQPVNIVINGGKEACEGMNAEITIENTEYGVNYYLALDETKTDLFVGDGSTQSKDLGPRANATYTVMGDLGGCSTMLGYFTFNPRPKPLEQESFHYCLPYGGSKQSNGVTLEYAGLESEVTYTLYRDGVERQSIVGPGIQSFVDVYDGNYTIIAQNNETGCTSETSFVVTGREKPKNFVLKADCAKDKNITLENSQVGIQYILLRDDVMLDTLYGTGKPLEFGVYNTTGVYTVMGVDTNYDCREMMNGNVVIREVGLCDLIQEKAICSNTASTEVLYPCSKEGWTYYLKDVTDKNNPKTSVSKVGNGSTLRWESMGTTKDLFKPHWLNPFVSEPSVYILYGKDGCGDIALDTLTIAYQNPPAATWYVDGITTLKTAAGQNKKTVAVCQKQGLTFTLTDLAVGVKCSIVGYTADNYRDSLIHFVATEDYPNNMPIGTFVARYQKIICALEDGDCRAEMTLQLVYKQMPELGLLDGESVCASAGTLNIKLKENIYEYNYYLVREGEDKPLDTIPYNSSALAFKEQTVPGRYYVIAENINKSDIGGYTPICRDTMLNNFAIGDSPKRLHVKAFPGDTTVVYLCKGETRELRMRSSQSIVDYALFKDGVEYGERQHKAYDGELSFGVTEEGMYTVRGFLGDCEEEMLDTIMVYADTIPDLELYDVYYYCRDEDGGAQIEVFEAPMYTTFTLKDAGIYGDALERDTVRFRGDTIRFDTKCPVGENYALTIKTWKGCEFHHPFRVEKMAPPTDVKLLVTANAICEGECTKIAILGDEGGIEYELVEALADGDAQYNDNFIMGFGDRDTLWFPYSVCSPGEYYVLARQYERPYCETKLTYKDQEIISLAQIDTIRECQFENNEVHYCDAKGENGTTIRLMDVQAGLQYYLYRGDLCLEDYGFPPLSTSTEGDVLVWNNVTSLKTCTGEYDDYTAYRVLAYNPVTECTKWMQDSVKVIGDDYVKLLAMTQPQFEFCEGGDLLLKARASGCGLNYQWHQVTTVGTFDVGTNSADLLLEAAGSTMSGSYYCEVSNACNSLTTSPYIKVSVRDSVEMEQMDDQTICEGGSALIYSKILHVNEGDYAWYKKGTDKILSRRSFLQFDTVTMDMQGIYVCVGGSEENGYCNVVRDTVYIAVAKNTNWLDIAQTSDTLCVGSPLLISIGNVVPDGYTVTWYLNGKVIKDATGVNNVTGNSYQKDKIEEKDAGLYSVKLSHTSGVVCGSSNLIPIQELVVDSDIQVLWHTEDRYMCEPGKIALEIKTAPMTGVKFDWYRLLEGSAQEELIGQGSQVLTEVPANNRKVTYRVYFYNTCPRGENVVTSQDIDVSIAENVDFEENLPVEITGCDGDWADTTLTVVLNGIHVQDYVWTYSPPSRAKVDTLASGVLSDDGKVRFESSYKVNFDQAHSGFYTCVMNTSCGKITSQTCWIRVNTPPVITADLVGASGKMCEGSYYTPTLTATGSDLQFRWYITYPNGKVDTVRKAIGYDWEAKDQLELLTDVKYNEALLQCLVWNNCGKALSQPVKLEIVEPREVLVSPAETWLCYDSTATVEVELVAGDGASWTYKLQQDDYSKVDYGPVKQVKDTLEGLIAGHYRITDLSDGVCDYKDKVMAEFMVYDVPMADVEYSLPSGMRDTTICAGTEVPMLVRITGGVGPFKVQVYYQEDTMAEPEEYNMWAGSTFTVVGAAAQKGTIVALPVVKDAVFSIKVEDYVNAKGAICPVEVKSKQVIKVQTVAKLSPSLSITDELRFGECQLDIDLRKYLNPNPKGGTFHLQKMFPGGILADTVIDRPWEFAKILKSDGAGMYKVSYSLTGVCKEKVKEALTVTIDSLPTARITPFDTIVCCKNGPNLQVYMNSYSPFDSLLIEREVVDDKGKVTLGQQWFKATPSKPLKSPVMIPFAMMADCSDSISYYTVSYLKDGHGCVMSGIGQPKATVRVRKLPSLRVIGYHPNYSSGMGDESTSTYNLNVGDSVRFRLYLEGGKTPWNLYLAHQKDLSTGIADLDTVIRIQAIDTVITLKEAGAYVFNAQEIDGCKQDDGDIVREIKLAPDGFVTIQGLYLGGALSHLMGSTPVAISKVRMQSKLPDVADFPDYGYDPVKFALYNSIADTKVIDWVFVEARKLNEQGIWSTVDRDSCLLLANGTVVDRNFNENLRFKGTGVSGEKFYIAVFHRNHLPVMTAHAQSFSTNGTGAAITFGYEQNYYVYEGMLKDHVWNFWEKNGVTLWVMAPSYRQIYKVNELVSMASMVATYLELDKASGMIMGIQPGYYDWDVSMNGKVEIPAFVTVYTQLPTMGKDEDAWIIFKNRDRYSEIKEDLTQ